MNEKQDTQIGIGRHIVVELIDQAHGRERYEFDLVPEDAADIANDAISVESPLGKAVRGRYVGDEIDYRMGDIERIRVIDVVAAESAVDMNAAARRREVVEEARRKSERTNADMFASSFSSKWGNYSTDDMDD